MGCVGIIGRVLGHRYRPRFDEGEPAISKVEGSPMEAMALIEASKPLTYVYDICTRCGRVIRRDGKEG